VLLSHLAAEVVAVVGEEVDDDGAAFGFEDAGYFLEDGGGVGAVREGEDEHGGVAGGVVDGKGGEVGTEEVDVFEVSEAAGGGFEHGGGVVDADDFLDVGGELFDGFAGAAAEVGDDGIAGEEGGEGGEGEGLAIEIGAELVPLGGGVGEEGLAIGLFFAEAAGEAKLVLAVGGPVLGLLAGEGPEASGGGVKLVLDHAVDVGSGLAVVFDPALVGEDLEVAADGGLGELEDVAKLDDAKLVVFEEAEEAEAGGVGEALHPGEEGVGLRGRMYHQCIRIIGLMEGEVKGECDDTGGRCSRTPYLSFLDTYLSQPPRADNQPDPSGPAEKREVLYPSNSRFCWPFDAPSIDDRSMAPGRP